MRAFSPPPRVAAAHGQKAPRGIVKALRWLVLLTAALYLAAITGWLLALRFIGERWWPTTAALYLPRIVLGVPIPILVLALASLGLYRLLWTQVAAAFLLLFPLMGLVISRPVPRPDAPIIHLLSYNVDSGVFGYAGVVDEISKASPDVVFLQEVGGPVDDLVQRLKALYSNVVVTGQLVLATRYEVVSEANPEKVLYNGRARSPRFTQYVIKTPLGPIAFYNVHPISPRAGLYSLRGTGLRRRFLSGHWLAPFDSSVLIAETGLRRAQVEDFVQAASHETLPVVISGDTNLPGLSDILRQNLSGYQDGFASVGEGFGYTFPTGHPWMRIDRIFASAALKFVSFQVGRSNASDHHCIMADLQAR
jgi:vancomycin resistance protein VanJ